MMPDGSATGRVRRSFMVVPIFDDHKIAKATRSGVDVIMLDLEDGVHHSNKSLGRERIAELLRVVDWRAKDVVVRVNPMSSEFAEDDIRAVAPAGPDAIILAKLDSAEEVQRAETLLASGAPQSVKIWGLVESARGIVNVESIALASTRLEALILGPGDLAADLQLNTRRYTMSGPDGQREEMLYFQSRLIAACRAAAISPISGIPTIMRDEEAAFGEARYLFNLGFATLGAFTPRMVDQVNRAYLPSPDDESWAREVLRVEAEKDADRVTFGVIGGAMVDGPFYRGARNILRRVDDTANTNAIDIAVAKERETFADNPDTVAS